MGLHGTRRECRGRCFEHQCRSHIGRQSGSVADSLQLQTGGSGIERQPAAAGEPLSRDRKETATELLPIERQRPDGVAIIADDPRRREQPGRQLAWRRPRCGRSAVEPVGEAVELQAAGGAACAVGDELQRVGRKVGAVFGQKLGAVAYRRNRADQIMAQARREQLQDPHVEHAVHG